jgi:deoxyribonuclease-1
MPTLYPFTVLLLSLLFACNQDTETHSGQLDTQVNTDGAMSVLDEGIPTLSDAGGSINVDLGTSDAGGSEQDFMLPPSGGCEPWAADNRDELVQTLHAHLVNTYEPIRPTPNFGGMPDRYTTARQMMFTRVFRFEDDEGIFVVQCVYTNDTAFTPPDRDPDADLMNCEHLWPRARLNSNRSSRLYEHQQSDIHHLAPTRPTANSLRGSFKFGEVARDRNLSASPSVAGRSMNDEQVFEPQDEVKGDIARVIFYMSVRWGLEISDGEESVLRRWHNGDPVQMHELAKNDVIESLQGNRNPFIDCPELVEMVTDFEAFDGLDTVESLPFP